MTKGSINANIISFLLLTDLKSNVGTIKYINVMDLTITVQRMWVRRELYYNKEMTPDGNWNRQEELREPEMVNNKANIHIL